ncbi:hypothetical protein Ahy_A03g015933 [Arachis hypogaea]|uniref:SWIM-type domain-containing protein n=1 Tax=Arachis hypogaea TaxID=3818 RepID=A0A445E1V9_ARAHY|nr:hypothetical protein Ahy_A03g015933 [Arachis hypogaea]
MSSIKSYTISRGVDYTVYQSEPHTFYVKCKGYGASFRRAGNIVVNWFDRHNEVFEVREMQDGTIYTVYLAQRHCDCGHFQVERLSCRHRLDWQLYVHDVYKKPEICKVYKGEFVLMGGPFTWDRYERAKVIANWTLRRATK